MLACVRGTGASGWPIGGALAKISRDGKVVAVVPADGCGGRLVHAGADLVVTHGAGDRDRELVVTRFDAALRAGGAGRVPVAGPIAAIAGRRDGSIAVAAIADSYEKDPRLELMIISRDPTNVTRWPLRGGQPAISQIIPDGDGIIAVGLVRGTATLDPDVSISSPHDGAFVLRVGASNRWARVIGSPPITPVSYEAPRIVKVADGFVMAWSIVSTGDRRRYPELDPFGGVPPPGYFTLFARLGHTGAIVLGRRELTGHDAGVQALELLPDGSILEQRTHVADHHPDFDCPGAENCVPRGGPDAYGEFHTLVVRRRDAASLETRGTATVSGEMMLEHVQVLHAGLSIIAVGTFIGTIDNPRGSVASPRSEHRPCAHASTSRTQRGGDLFALQPPDNPCRIEITRHGALFAVRLNLR